MSVYSITYTYKKSQYLCQQLNDCLTRLNVPHMVVMDSDCTITPNAVIRYKTNYKGGHSFADAMQKIEGYKQALKVWDIKDDDWLMDMDDDTFMAGQGWLKALGGDRICNYTSTRCGTLTEYRRFADPVEFDVAGIQHETPYPTALGMFTHMSGACLCMKGWLVKKIVTLDWEQLFRDMRAYKLPVVWDLIISYGCIWAGAKTLNMSKVLDLSVTFEDYLKGKPGHFFHFNGEWKELMGYPLPNGRYSIPEVLEKINYQHV